MVKKLILYFSFVLLFLLERPVFMAFHSDVFSAYSIGEKLLVMWHGLPHDFTCAGYVMALPFLAAIPAIWLGGPWHRTFMRWYLRIILVPVLLIFFVDLGLYGYWGFRLDSTPLIYLFDNPIDALALCPWWAWTIVPVMMYVLWWVLQKAMLSLFPARQNGTPVTMPRFNQQLWLTGGAILLCGLCFVAIRGGVTTSTMNVGRVYFSTEMPLNHAATNPIFSFFNSLGKTQDFSRRYRFMSDAEVDAAFAEMDAIAIQQYIGRQDSAAMTSLDAPMVALADTSVLAVADTLPASLLSVDRPNILLILFESFSGAACQALYPEADPTIMPNVNRMYREGIGFTHMYANSFRTDRGTAAVLASYPGQPTYSVMKEQQKCNHLDYLSAALGNAGYELQFVHGGDVNFTNMKGFLRAGRITDIVGDSDFPVSDRLSKWGVPDHVTFSFLYDQIVSACQQQTTDGHAAPFFKAFLTLSSHEPFEVDYHHHADPYVNSVAYADSCLGSLVDRLRQTPYWDNLLIIGLPDHCYSSYPQGIQNHEPLRYHIPMFWTGGAISAPRLVDTYGSQTDLAATLLAQMGLPHEHFVFSKDLMADSIPHYAFYAFSDGFGFLTDSISYIQDNQHDGYPLSGSHDPDGKAQQWGKAYLQHLYDDLSRR